MESKDLLSFRSYTEAFRDFSRFIGPHLRPARAGIYNLSCRSTANQPAPGQHSSSVDTDHMDRIATLSEILAHDPNNAFARYGLALEYANTGEHERALEEFAKLLSANPDYAAGYFMAAQTLVKSGRTDDAKKMLTDGIAAAAREGDSHAQGEMQAMLDDLS